MEEWNLGALNGEMIHLIKNGPRPLPEISDENQWGKSARLTANMTRVGRARGIADLVSSRPEFPSFSKILDMGCGCGLIGVAVTAAHPFLKCYLMDKPPVAKVADEIVAEYGMEDRIETIAGDYVNDPIGEGYDFIMANYTLNFYKGNLDGIMTKVRAALKPGGLFLVTSDGLTDEKTAPDLSVISWLPVQLQGTDMSFQYDDIPNAMFKAGFSWVHSLVLEEKGIRAHGPIAVSLAKK